MRGDVVRRGGVVGEAGKCGGKCIGPGGGGVPYFWGGGGRGVMCCPGQLWFELFAFREERSTDGTKSKNPTTCDRLPRSTHHGLRVCVCVFFVTLGSGDRAETAGMLWWWRIQVSFVP